MLFNSNAYKPKACKPVLKTCSSLVLFQLLFCTTQLFLEGDFKVSFSQLITSH